MRTPASWTILDGIDGAMVEISSAKYMAALAFSCFVLAY
jgi:hypothetical protein